MFTKKETINNYKDVISNFTTKLIFIVSVYGTK